MNKFLNLFLVILNKGRASFLKETLPVFENNRGLSATVSQAILDRLIHDILYRIGFGNNIILRIGLCAEPAVHRRFIIAGQHIPLIHLHTKIGMADHEFKIFLPL